MTDETIAHEVHRRGTRITIDVNQAVEARANGELNRFRQNIREIIEQLEELLKL